MIYWQLFITFFKIGLFNFGGGYAMISFIQNEVVFKRGWLGVSEFTDMVAVSQMTPGPIGINLATYTGYTASGSVWGSFLATAAVCLPSFILMILISKYLLKYRKSDKLEAVFCGLRPAVVGLIAAAALVLCNEENFTDWRSVFLFLLTFIAVKKWKINAVWMLVFAGAIGWFIY